MSLDANPHNHENNFHVNNVPCEASDVHENDGNDGKHNEGSYTSLVVLLEASLVVFKDSLLEEVGSSGTNHEEGKVYEDAWNGPSELQVIFSTKFIFIVKSSVV
jgi:hypothetical protein